VDRMTNDDHEIVEIATNVRWIRDKLGDLCDREDATELRVGGLELWRAEMIGLEISERLKDHDERITSGTNKDWMTKGVVALLVIILTGVGIGRWIDFCW